MRNFLVLQHIGQSKMLVRDCGDGWYEYYHGMWSKYSVDPIKLPLSTKIISRFEAENNKEAVLIFNLLE